MSSLAELERRVSRLERRPGPDSIAVPSSLTINEAGEVENVESGLSQEEIEDLIEERAQELEEEIENGAGLQKSLTLAGEWTPDQNNPVNAAVGDTVTYVFPAVTITVDGEEYGGSALGTYGLLSPYRETTKTTDPYWTGLLWVSGTLAASAGSENKSNHTLGTVTLQVVVETRSGLRSPMPPVAVSYTGVAKPTLLPFKAVVPVAPNDGLFIGLGVTAAEYEEKGFVYRYGTSAISGQGFAP